MTVSFVGSNALAGELCPSQDEGKPCSNGEGVYVTQVVPFPTDETNPTVESYLRALQAHAPGSPPGFVSFEGYLAGRLAIFALDGCGADVSRECFLDSLESADMVSLDGFTLRYGQDDNQGSDAVFLTAIGEDGRYRAVETLDDAKN